MIYSLLIIVGLLGILGTLWISHPRLHSAEQPSGDPWYVLHPENFESGVIEQLRTLTRAVIKWILIWMISIYRKLSEQITVKEVLKKKIRGFLYEHTHDSIRHPSEFWNKVKKQPKGKPRASKPLPEPTVETEDTL